MMKKVISVILILIMVFCLAACGSNSDNAAEEGSSAEKELVRKIVLDGETTDVDVFDGAIIGMHSSDGTYFTFNYDGGTPGVTSSHHNVYKVDEATFNETSHIDVWQFSDEIMEGTKAFLNSSYASIQRPTLDSSNGNAVFGNLFCNSMASRSINPLFGESLEGYFDEHKLSLSCDEVKIEQVAVSELQGHYTYIFSVSANVSTEDCTGNMSDLGFFANKGESKNLNVYLVCEYLADDNTISLSYINIK